MPRSWLLGLLLLLPALGWGSTPVLTLRATVAPAAGVDVTAFVDLVEIVNASTSTVVASAVPNSGFETTGSLGAGSYGYNPTGANWAFNAGSGIASNGSAFSSPTAPEGTHVAFLQTNASAAGSVSLALPTLGAGTYWVRLQLAQRNTGPANQGVQVLVNGVALGTSVPANNATFQAYTTSGTFTATDDVLRVEGTGSPTTPGSDVTAFIDLVEIVDVGTGTAVASAVPNPGFETTGSLGAGSYGYSPTGANWTFSPSSGIATNGSAFNNVTAPEGTHVAFLQSNGANNGSVQQALTGLAPGTYQVRLRASQRATSPSDQGVRILVKGVLLTTFTPVTGSFQTFLSSSFIIGPTIINSFTPTSAPAGSSVTISGTNLGSATGLTLNGVAVPLANITANTVSSLTFTVPSGATSGTLTVTTAAGTSAASSQTLTITIPPAITSFTPTTGTVGTSVVVTGTSMSAVTALTLNGVTVPPANITANTATSLTFSVPAGATSGKLRVTTATGTSALSSQTFYLKPIITSFTPSFRAVGGSVTITGTNIGGATGLTLNGVTVPLANITANTATSLTFTVPAGATSGTLNITTAGGTSAPSSQILNITTATSPSLTFSPAAGIAGSLVTVTGTGLSAATAVYVNGYAGNIMSTSATTLTFTVSVGTTSGVILVITPTGQYYSATNFLVGLPMPSCYEDVDTVSTAANGGYTQLVVCDDCYQQIDLGFSFAFYGNTYSQCYISNNGVVSFGAGVSSYTGQAFPTTGYGPMIAPYWADVDTRSTGSGRVWYKLYPDRLVVLWSRVGYYPIMIDKKNSFQLILRRNTVVPSPAADITFVYGDLQWLLGSASGGVLPQIGFDAGDGVNYYNVPGTLTNAVLNYRQYCLNYTVGSTPQVSSILLQYSPTVAGFNPKPVGVGQEVSLTANGLGGATSVVVNGANATASKTNNTAGTLTFRVPSSATLVGNTTVSTPTGTVASSGLTVLPAPGLALAFDGVDDQVSVPHAAALNLTTALTVEAWVRTSSTAEQYIVTKSDDSWYLALNGAGLASGRASFYLNGPSTVGGWLYGTTNLADGRWHHVAGTYDGSTLRLIVDGVQENSRPATGAVATGTAPLLLGSRPSRTSFSGSIDEVRIWRTARTATELEAGRQLPPTLPAPDLVAYFNFDRGTPGGQNQSSARFHEVVSAMPATLLNFALTGSASNWVESYAMVLPRSLGATAILPTSFTLRWQAPARGSVTGYVIQVSTSASFATPTTYPQTINALGLNWGSQAVTGLTAGTTYYYRVRADRTPITGQGAYVTGSLTTPTTAASCTTTLTSYTPTSGTIGNTTVTLTGTNLSALTVTAIRFGNVSTTSFTIVNATTITVVVPPAAVSGSISLVTPCGQTSNAQTFTVNTPTVTQITPLGELPGQPVTITGTGFVPGSTVVFGVQPATVVNYISPTSLVAIVPVPLTGYSSYAPVSVSTLNGNTQFAGSNFTTYSVANPAAVNLCSANTVVVDLGSSGWSYLLNNNNQVILAFNGQGRYLGIVGCSYLQADLNQEVRMDALSHKYMGRNWRLTTSAGPFTGNSVLVRFFGLNTEYDQLQAADPGKVLSLSSLRLTQYSGPNEDCVLSNNASGNRVLLTPTSATYGPDGSGFFMAQATVPDHFSEFYLHGGTTPLPVELTDFTATRVAGQPAVQLAWATASEKRSAYFDVERSTDGRSFERIGTVAAAGNSLSPRSYSLPDNQLPAGVLTLYYRLRAVDQDGAVSYSPVRTVLLEGQSGPVVYPNPTTGTATLLGSTPGALVLVFDALGRVVLRTTAAADGSAALVLPAGLATGLYIVRAGTQALRLVVK